MELIKLCKNHFEILKKKFPVFINIFLINKENFSKRYIRVIFY